MLVVGGMVNAVPALRPVSAGWMRPIYDLDVLDDDLALLLRHRAVPFGMLGAGLAVATWRSC